MPPAGSIDGCRQNVKRATPVMIPSPNGAHGPPSVGLASRQEQRVSARLGDPTTLSRMTLSGHGPARLIDVSTIMTENTEANLER